MGNMTKRQKRLVRDFVTGLSGCAAVAIILTLASITRQEEHIPVVFSDILDGATVIAGTENEENPAVSLEKDYLYETLFENETIILTTTSVSTASTTTAYEPQGAGGTILINTTEITEPPPETKATTTTVPTQTTTSKTTKQTTSITTEYTTSKTTTRTSETTVKTTTQAPKTTTTTVTTAPKTSATTSKTPFTNIGGGTISDDDEVYIEMLRLVNEVRVENGLKELWYSARVHEVATLRAYELTSYYSHSRSDGRGFHTAFLDSGISYWTVGENIAYGRNMFDTVEEVFEAWMDSESHRANILSPNFECVGFGLATLKVGNDTYYYWSQEFATFK